MENNKMFALRCILFGLNEMEEKLKYTNKPETLKVYCECIEMLARTYKMIENEQEANENEC